LMFDRQPIISIKIEFESASFLIISLTAA